MKGNFINYIELTRPILQKNCIKTILYIVYYFPSSQNYSLIKFVTKIIKELTKLEIGQHHTLYFDKALILASINIIEALEIVSKVFILIILRVKNGFIKIVVFYDRYVDGKVR